jgi:hypothetical protein
MVILSPHLAGPATAGFHPASASPWQPYHSPAKQGAELQRADGRPDKTEGEAGVPPVARSGIQ